MGFFSAITGIGGTSGADAARIEEQFNQQGIDELKRQFGVTQAKVDPFIAAGTGALPGVQEGATVGGLDRRVAEILGLDTFQPLVEERTRAVEGQLASTGLSRSGTALEEIAGIPTDLAFAIEQMLSGRGERLAGQGLQAGLGLGQLGGQSAGGIANLLRSSGEARSAGQLTDDQATAEGISRLLGLAGGAAGGGFQASQAGTSVGAGALQGLFFGGK